MTDVTGRSGGTGRLCAAVALLAMIALPPAARAEAPANAVTVVRPGAMGGWSVVNVDPANGTESPQATPKGTRGELTDGPAPVPAGLGSLRQVLGAPGESQRVEHSMLNGHAIADLNDLSYSTYVHSSGGGVATLVQILVDLNADGRFRLTEDDVLTFEPVYQTAGARGDAVPNQCAGIPTCVGLSVWQRWDADVGGWWSYRAGNYGPPLVTLDHYQAQYPSARVATDVPGLRLSAGGGAAGWNGFDGHLDRVAVDGTEFDFESMFLIADCSRSADDIALIQSKVDTAPAGYAVRLRGACDVAAAAPHGGTTTSIDAAAVVLRANAPAQKLVIESDGAPGSAAVIGSGTQTAFFVPPGSSDITIRGLSFSNLARPIVVASSINVTIGSVGSETPDPSGNRIAGGAGMDSAILAVATPASVTVAFGVAGSRSATYPASPALAGLTVAGNRISYDALGVPDAAHSMVAIDVRQAAGATASGIAIRRNAAWFATNELRSFDINAVRVQAAVAGAISGVTVQSNSLGRPEDVGGSAPPTSAGGRAGILIQRVANARVTANTIRARMSVTPTPVPGGGIVIAETSDATVDGNRIWMLVEPGTEAADLGAIGVVDDLDLLLGGAGGPAASTRVSIVDNTIGEPGSGAHRGLLIAGSSWVDARRNNVRFSSGAALAIAADVEGAGGVTLPQSVAASILCANTLDGVLDDPNQVAVDNPTATTGSNFPGGSLIPGNAECADPGISFVETAGSTSPVEGGASDTYTVVLDARPRADVGITITGGGQAQATPASLTFTPATWAISQTVTVSAVQDAIPEGTHLQALTHQAQSSDPDYVFVRTLLVTILDDDPGSVVLIESGGSTVVAEGGANDTYTLALGSRPSADVRIATAGGTQLAVSPPSVLFTQADWSVPKTLTVVAVDDRLREGPHLGALTHRAFSPDPNFEGRPVPGLVAAITDNDVPAAPVILIPTEGSTVRQSSLILTGTGEPQATLEVTEGATLVGTATISGQGRWSVGPVIFAEGPHAIAATQVDRNGFRSAPATRSFRVDLTPPAPPVIVEPAEGAVLLFANVPVRGTAEPFGTVVLTEGSLVRTTTAGSSGDWQVTILFPAGEHAIVATVFDGAGNPGPSSPVRRFRVDADGIPPAAPIIDSPAEGAIVAQSRTGPGGETLPGFSLSGRTEPRARLEIWEGSQPVTSGTADSNGVFDIGLSLPESRTWRLSVRAIDTSFNRGPFAAPRTLNVDGIRPTVSIRRPSGQALITIVLPAEDVVTFGAASDNFGIASVTVTYTDLFGRSITRPAAVCCLKDAAYEWTDNAPLAPGLYRVRAVSIDLAGNESRPSNAQILRL